MKNQPALNFHQLPYHRLLPHRHQLTTDPTILDLAMNPLADQMMDLCLDPEKGQTLKADLAYCQTAPEIWKVQLVVREE